ncbi:hypothetical protein [Synechococcus sp. MIT S1220]|uniref:hypothetical protein n=1 Tax=Synechococcus sp. MIT S1220 TaxID=3082549 RepID=UPI0039B02ADB
MSSCEGFFNGLEHEQQRFLVNNDEGKKLAGDGMGQFNETFHGNLQNASTPIERFSCRLRDDSTHQKPNNSTAQNDSFKELSPGQPIRIQLKGTHHQVEDFFVLSNEKWTISSIELLDLLELDLTEFWHAILP